MIAVRREPRTEPWIRGPVAVVVSRFPKLTETFVLREIVEMERQGQAVRLVALHRERAAVVHPEARPWLDRLLAPALLSRAVAAANLRELSRRPARYLGLLARLLGGTRRRPGVAVRTLATFPLAVALAERLRAEGVAHVHAHFATYPATAAWVIHELTGIGFSFTVHAHDLFVHQLLLAEKIATAAFVRTISDFNRECLVALAPAAAGRIEVVRVGLDVAARAIGEAPGGTPRLLAVAALEEYKGLPVLVEACALLAARGIDYRCEIVGRGPLRRRLERQIREHGLGERVELAGALAEDAVAERMRRATIVVQPSVVAASGQMEGIPVALMEAMAAGRPVVASRLSGIPELVEHGRSGLLVPPGDAAALADAIARLLADPEEAARLGRAGRTKVAARHDLAATTAALLDRLDAELEPLPGGEALAGLDGVLRASARTRLERADSEVIRLRVARGAGARDLILKRQRSRPGESAPPAVRAEREASVLEEVARRAPGAGVPRVVSRAPGGEALVLEACAGEPLDRLIRRLRSGPPEALDADLARAGAWLAAFQDAFPRADAPGARLDELLAAIESTGARELAAAIDRERLRCVRTHGDFWPGNLFVSETGVEAIDFEGSGAGLAEQDAADFLVELRLFFLRPGGERRFRRAARAFLAGWDRGEETALRLCVMRAARARRPAPPGLPAPVRFLRRRALDGLARCRRRPW